MYSFGNDYITYTRSPSLIVLHWKCLQECAVAFQSTVMHLFGAALHRNASTVLVNYLNNKYNSSLLTNAHISVHLLTESTSTTMKHV